MAIAVRVHMDFLGRNVKATFVIPLPVQTMLLVLLCKMARNVSALQDTQ